MTEKVPYSRNHVALRNLIRLYVLAGDQKKENDRKQKVRNALKDARWELSKNIGRKLGWFASLEWFELLGEYIKNMRRLADAGDNNLPNKYKKALNILIANKDKRLQFIRERLDPPSEELKNIEKLLMTELVGTSGYIRCRDQGLMTDELNHWSTVRSVNTQLGKIMDDLIDRRRDEHEKERVDVRPGRHGDGCHRG